jgi:AmmeMemoRadiSam system protein B
LKLRKPCVANGFYEGTKTKLQDQIANCFTHKLGPGRIPKPIDDGQKRILGFVVPHAGYMYSGPVAAHSYAQLASDGNPDVLIILGPNHTGLGSGVSMMTKGAWETPLGISTIDTVLAEEIRKASDIIDEDERAHMTEHSIEVQLPFIQFLYGDKIKFIPICMMMQDLQTSQEIARSIAEQTKGRHAVVIASSDFTHYEPQNVAARNDKTAVDAITALDGSTLNGLGETNRVTMCGYGPITTLMELAKLEGNVNARLLSYHTSGDITNDASSVVGYASILFTRD